MLQQQTKSNITIVLSPKTPTIGEDGNIKADGTAIFTPTANGCSIDYHGRLALDMPINRMMAKVLKPVIQTVIAQEMRAYVKRMISAAEA